MCSRPAGAEFQKILDNPAWFRTTPIGAMAHLGLGRPTYSQATRTSPAAPTI